ncbi:amidohydrolase family protein [Novosphingobium sp.]|uniref:metal-dependent hydrolase family protein n=1 Tax=Novosphingobium sp. TaxID=1874826 RepID=UPI00286D416B|nr:amidohydrolase family protein [Novosphingobium sp.]
MIHLFKRFTGLFALLGLAGSVAAISTTPEVVFVHVGHLIEPATGAVQDNQLMRIENGRIHAVEPWHSPPDGTQVIDWSGKWVLPGLIDAHVHLADYLQTNDPAEPLKHSTEETAYLGARNARATLEAGFTSVHDVGSYRANGNIELRNAINRGDVLGPRINAVGGYITVPGGGGEVTGLPKGMKPLPEMRVGVARTPAEVTRKVNRMFALGADSIKLIATGAVLTEGTEPGQIELTGPMIAAAVKAATAHGSWVTSHAHGAAGIKLAILNGSRGIEHASLIDDAGIALAKARGTYLVMDIYNGDYIAEVGRRDGWSASILRKNDETTEAQRQGFTKAVRAGARVVFGTDAGVFPHGLQARQFSYMVRYGMTPLQAIQAATSTAAEFLGWGQDVGSLTPGHYADMIALDANPLEDVTTLEHVGHVIKGGVVVR